MRILIFGGTVFLGRHIAEAALTRGHELTLFTRGQHNPDLFPQAEHLRGDRTGDLSALDGRTWDAVIDTSGYVPRVVRASAERVRGAAPRYLFVSTLSVFALDQPSPFDEDAPVLTLDDPSAEEVTGESYGPLKAACEQVVREVFPDGAFIIRPGLIVGPHDQSDRFTYWPVRVARGGDVLAPGRPGRMVRFSDARDLAEWIVRAAEEGLTGTFNADGPGHPTAFEELLFTCRDVAGSDARFHWIDDSTLLDLGVEPWMDLPLWIPESPEFAGFYGADSSRAVAAGLTFRPVADTVRDTLAWAETRPAGYEWRAELTAEREGEVLLQAGVKSSGTLET